MCPLVSGIKTKDAALSAELGMRALDLAVGATSAHPGDEVKREGLLDGSACCADNNGVLRRGGHLVIKLLESEDIQGGITLHGDHKPAVVKMNFLLPFCLLCRI